MTAINNTFEITYVNKLGQEDKAKLVGIDRQHVLRLFKTETRFRNCKLTRIIPVQG